MVRLRSAGEISRLDPEADEGDPRGLIERALRYVARKAW
jgi:hypothetical protein